jgi:hypothetical protein
VPLFLPLMRRIRLQPAAPPRAAAGERVPALPTAE